MSPGMGAMRKRVAYFIRPFRLCQIRNPPTSAAAIQVRGSETGVISPLKPISPLSALSINMEGGLEETKEPQLRPATNPSPRNVSLRFNVIMPGSVPSLDSRCSRDLSDFSASPIRRENDVWAWIEPIDPTAQLKNMVKPTKERLLALHIFSSAEMFRILGMQQRRCYTWMRRLRIFRPRGLLKPALFCRGRSDQNYCVACRVVARCEDVQGKKRSAFVRTTARQPSFSAALRAKTGMLRLTTGIGLA
jgi:hypothetical protein